MEFKGNSLGDISGMISQELPDLSWLNVDISPLPVVSNPNYVVPELVEAWSWEEPKNMAVNLTPNSISCAPPIRVVTATEIEDAVKTAKKAMMQGLKGEELASHVSSKVDPEVLGAASQELSKLASEEGLLGHVYMDLSPFDTTREAALLLGGSRLKMASFIVGSPAKESSFVDPSGNVRNMGLPHCASNEVNQTLVKRYASILEDKGYDVRHLSDKETLRRAFINGPVVEEKVYGADEVKQTPVDAEDVLKKASALSLRAASEAASEAAWGRDRQVLAYLQDEMVKGKTGLALTASLNSKFDPHTIALASDRVAKFASLQGMLGQLYVDVALPGSTDDAIRLIKSAANKPFFIMSSKEGMGNRLNAVASATGCSVLTRDGVSAKQASEVISSLASTGRIASDTATDLHSRVASGDSTMSVLRTAYSVALTMNRKASAVAPCGVFAVMAQGEKVDDVLDTVDKEHLKLASKSAIEKGFAISAIEGKVASSVPAGEAVSIVRQVLASMDVVPARSLERCSSMRYPLKQGATIEAAPKCASCVFAMARTCSKQAATLTGTESKDPVVRMASSNPVFEFQLSAPVLSVPAIGVAPKQAAADTEFSASHGLTL